MIDLGHGVGAAGEGEDGAFTAGGDQRAKVEPMAPVVMELAC